MYEELKKAVSEGLKVVGIPALKKTSLMIRNPVNKTNNT